MYDIDSSALDRLDLDQNSTVYWEGSNRRFSKLSSAIRCVMDEILIRSNIPPGITIFDSPYFLEIEQIEYIYENRLTTKKRVEHAEQQGEGEATAKRTPSGQSEMDRNFEEALKELGFG